MRRGNVHCEQRSLQQVSLATLCGACLPSQWCMHQFMVQLCLYQYRGDRGAVPEDIMRAGGCPGAALCTTAFSEECVLGKTPSSGTGMGNMGQLAFFFKPASVLSMDNFFQKSKKYLVEIPFLGNYFSSLRHLEDMMSWRAQMLLQAGRAALLHLLFAACSWQTLQRGTLREFCSWICIQQGGWHGAGVREKQQMSDHRLGSSSCSPYWAKGRNWTKAFVILGCRNI